MDKSKRISIFYILSSISLLLVLMFGGIYGIYVSVGLSFVRSSISNFANVETIGSPNISIGGSLNYSSSMTGVIILSVFLIVLAIFDFVSLIKQIIFFKQFKVIENSKIEKAIENKCKSKSRVVFFAFLIDILSFGVGIAGILINNYNIMGGNLSWILYLIDGLVSLFSLISFILLIIKLNKIKKYKKIYLEKYKIKEEEKTIANDNKIENIDGTKIDEIEYYLLKLKHLKTSKIISNEEYEKLRNEILGKDSEKIVLKEKEKKTKI